MAHLRRQTPDSEALASSDDDHPINKSITSLKSQAQRRGSWLSEVHASQQRKPSFTSASLSSNQSQPGTPAADTLPWPAAMAFGNQAGASQPVPLIGGSIWSTNKPPGLAGGGQFSADNAEMTPEALAARPSKVVDLQNAERRRLEREHQAKVKLQAATQPQAVLGAPQQLSLPFVIPLKPTLKATRSLSYSAGQQEDQKLPNSSLRTSSRDTGGILLGQVTEENDDASIAAYSDHEAPILDERLATGHAQNGLPSPAAAFNYQQIRHSLLHSQLNSSSHRQELHNTIGRRSNWQTQSPFGPLTLPPESRRHSMAEIPTRRGSSSSDHIHDDLKEMYKSNPERVESIMKARAKAPPDTQWNNDEYRYTPVTTESYSHPQDPEQNYLMDSLDAKANPYKTNYIVSFKCSRVGVYFLLPGCGLQCKPGNMVIVEADRGQDLGTIIRAGITLAEARDLSLRYSEEQYKWLMMFSRHNQAGNVNPNGNGASGPGQRTRMPHDDIKPKAIKRIATQHEVMQLQRKEGVEAKAKRTCQQLVDTAGLDMEILDAEWQWDWQKLVFYYFADKYVDFKALVSECFKIYKVRIWMSAVNPASFSRNVTNEPPSGIGPGAILPRHGLQSFDNTYHMMYGADPDPYGAMPPYPVPENEANPNTMFGGDKIEGQYHPNGSNLVALATTGATYGRSSYTATLLSHSPDGHGTQNGDAHVSETSRGMYWPNVTPNPVTVARQNAQDHFINNSAISPMSTTLGNGTVYPTSHPISSSSGHPSASPLFYNSYTKDANSPINFDTTQSSRTAYHANQPALHRTNNHFGASATHSGYNGVSWPTGGDPWPTFQPGRPLQPPIGTRTIGAGAGNMNTRYEHAAEDDGGVSLHGIEQQLRGLSFGDMPSTSQNGGTY